MKGKKAFVFTLDIAIASLVAILIMTAAHRNMANAEANRVSNAQMLSAAGDIAAVLDYRGVLQTMNAKQIESEMELIMPQNIDMRLKIVSDDDTILYAGGIAPEGKFVGTGKRFFTIKGSGSSEEVEHYAYVSYWVWSR